jgi:hypothetical protein
VVWAGNKGSDAISREEFGKISDGRERGHAKVKVRGIKLLSFADPLTTRRPSAWYSRTYYSLL